VEANESKRKVLEILDLGPAHFSRRQSKANATIVMGVIRMSAPAVAEQSPVRLRRAPTLEPPFDDEPAGPQPLAQPGRGPRTQRPVTPRPPRGPVGPSPAGGAAPPIMARPALVPVPTRIPHAQPAQPPQPPQPAQPPRPIAATAHLQPTPAQAAAQRFIGVCVEILNGHRPPGHLRAVVAPLDLQQVGDQLIRRTNRAYLGRPGATVPGPNRVRLRALHVGEPRDGVAEIAAVLEYGVNHWAMCARLERRADTWLCTLVQVL
jgi:hypothetical protein